MHRSPSLRCMLGGILIASGLCLPQARAAIPGPCTGPASRVVTVGTAAALTAALSGARAGDRISLRDGRYPGRFTLRASGTGRYPITLCGSSQAVLDGGSYKTGYGLHVEGKYVRLLGFAIQRSQKGVMLDGAANTLISGLRVSQVGDEGIHLRSGSHDVRVTRSLIHHTGLRVRSFGEGVYIGTASSKWCGLTSCNPDRNDHAVIDDNRFYALGAEAVDAKEGTSHGLVSGNDFDGRGSDAYSWVDIKGNAWTVTDNRGVSSRRDGLSVSVAMKGWGVGNTLTGNQVDVRGPGYGLRVPSGNVVGCDNQVLRAEGGFSNVACR